MSEPKIEDNLLISLFFSSLKKDITSHTHTMRWDVLYMMNSNESITQDILSRLSTLVWKIYSVLCIYFGKCRAFSSYTVQCAFAMLVGPLLSNIYKLLLNATINAKMTNLILKCVRPCQFICLASNKAQ